MLTSLLCDKKPRLMEERKLDPRTQKKLMGSEARTLLRGSVLLSWVAMLNTQSPGGTCPGVGQAPHMTRAVHAQYGMVSLQ